MHNLLLSPSSSHVFSLMMLSPSSIPGPFTDNIEMWVAHNVHHSLITSRLRFLHAIKRGFFSNCSLELCDYIRRAEVSGIAQLLCPHIPLLNNTLMIPSTSLSRGVSMEGIIGYTSRQNSYASSNTNLLNVSNISASLLAPPSNNNTNYSSTSSLPPVPRFIDSPPLLVENMSELRRERESFNNSPNVTLNDTSSLDVIVFSGGSAFDNASVLLNELNMRIFYIMPISDDGGSTKEIIRILGGKVQ
jgi:hypothetical protein